MIVLDRTQAVHRAVRLATLAPSVHNTQPWRIAIRGAEITLGTDDDRRLRLADPDGRQLRISCGAALFTLRLALRHLGFPPEVRTLPEPDSPGVLARLQVPERHLRVPDNGLAEVFAEIERRRTHRGPFTAEPLDEGLVSVLRRAAATEKALLRPVRDPGERGLLAAVTQAAQYAQRADRARAEELARWTRDPGSPRDDGVPAAGWLMAEDAEFPGRWSARTGTVVADDTNGRVHVLATERDDPAAWLAAGQALQRVLLEAAARDVRAAIHTQPLEEPELRAFLTRRLADGHPQMILRLGHATAPAPTSRRRPIQDTTFEIP